MFTCLAPWTLPQRNLMESKLKPILSLSYYHIVNYSNYEDLNNPTLNMIKASNFETILQFSTKMLVCKFMKLLKVQENGIISYKASMI